MSDQDENKEKLPGPWREIQGAIWLIGLAILFWQDWFWPGILVVVAVSAIFEALVRLVVNPQPALPETAAPGEYRPVENQSAGQTPAARLPSRCPNCGAPISEDVVKWSDNHQHASCPYCKSNIAIPA